MMRALVWLALLASAPAHAASARALVGQGNSEYAAERFDEARAAYRLAAEQAPEIVPPRFNEGAALYRAGEFEQAAGAFQEAARLAGERGDARVEAAGRYNLGNALFRSSEAYSGGDPRRAVEALEKSVRAYQEALRLDSQLAEAPRNIAAARKRMKELLDRMRQQPPGASSGDRDDRLRGEVEKSLRDQEQAENRREQAENERGQQSEEQREQQAQQMQSEQQDLEQRSRELSEELRKRGRDEADREASERLEQAAENQRQAAEQLGSDNLDQAAEAQRNAKRNLEQALQALRGQPSEADPQPRDGSPPPGRPEETPLQALDQSPRNILDEERANRRRRQMMKMGQSPVVEKDW